MSIGHRVQEIWLHKVTHAHQNHKTCSTSWAYSSNLMGTSPHHVRIFRKYRNRSLTWCKSGLHSSLRSWVTGAWISPISEASSWTRLLQRSHMTTVAVTAVSTALWTLDHLKYTYRIAGNFRGNKFSRAGIWSRKSRKFLEIWLHKVTHAHQNHKTCSISWAYSSNLMGMSPPSCEDFQKVQKQIFNLVQVRSS